MAAQGQRIDLSAQQPGAWAVIRQHTLHGLQRDLVRTARERGVDVAALAAGTGTAGLDLIDAIDVLTLQYQVIDWQLTDDDGTPLPPPREVTAAHLAYCDGEVLRVLLEAINAQRGTGDAEATIHPNPTTPSGASSPAN